MRSILKPGKYSYIHTCSKCECVFAFLVNDCSHFFNKYLIGCPQCGKIDEVLQNVNVDEIKGEQDGKI